MQAEVSKFKQGMRMQYSGLTCGKTKRTTEQPNTQKYQMVFL